MVFVKASKSLAKAKLLLTGPSGSGKTFSALRLAAGLGGKTAVIDTENNSASLYADQFPGWEYFVLPLSPPYTAQKYFQAIEEAARDKFEILIIDSATHLWAGEGGLLEQKAALDTRGGNSYTNWNSIGKLNEHFKSQVLHSPMHIICTARSKQEYIIETNEKGKQAPRKVGLAPILRDGMEYEFTTVFDIGMDHQFMVSKDRTNLFDGVVATITEKTGQQIRSWLADEITAEPIADFVTEAAAFSPGELDAMKAPHNGRVAVTKISAAVTKKKPRITPKNEAPQPAKDFDPGDYVIKFGEKMGTQGKRIRDINESLIRGLIKWVDDDEAKGKVLHASQKEFREFAKDFLASVGCIEKPAPEPEVLP